ncbi:MAG: DMT family transporter [Chitinophagaceae bacterium]
MKKISYVNILLFLVPTTIWSTSFLLIKESLKELSVWQVGSIRIISAGIILLPLAWKYQKKVTKRDLLYLLMSGTMGALLPAYFSALGEVHLSQTEASVFNSLTPVFTIIFGVLFFNFKTKIYQWIGVSMGLIGAMYLNFSLHHQTPENININIYSFFAILNTCLYAINLHFIIKKLSHLPFLVIVTFTFTTIIPLAILIFLVGWITDSHAPPITCSFSVLESIALGVFASTLANIALYKLIKNTGSLITSYTSYVTPVFALIIGVFYGDMIKLPLTISLLFILLGVAFVQKHKAT